MPQVKKKNMPKRIAPMIKNIVGSQLTVEFFIYFPGFFKIIKNFKALCFSISTT